MDSEGKDQASLTVEMVPTPQEDSVLNYRLTKKSAWGMGLVGLASIFGSLMTICVSYIAKTYKLSSPTITFTRSVFNLAINLICCAVVKVNPFGSVKDVKKFWWIVFRGLFGGIQITCYFFAFTKIPAGDATTLTFSAPVITGILAIFMLKEKWGVVDAFASVCCFIGVLFTAKPSWLFHDAPVHLDGGYVTIALIGSLAAALAYIAVRKVGPSVSVFVLINYVLFFTLIINIYQGYASKLHAFPWPKSGTPLKAWLLLAGISILGALAQFSINRGLQLEKAGPATSMRFLDIVLTYIWQIVFLHESVDGYSIVGASLVSICLIVIGLNKWWNIRKARLIYEQSIQK